MTGNPRDPNKKRGLRAARVYVDKHEIDLRLAKLGWSRGPIIQAAIAGDLMRRSCTYMDAAGVPGYYLWSRALRVLNEDLCAKHGTHPGRYLQIPVAFDNDEARAIAVSSGDRWTGRNGDQDPATKNIKGFATLEAIEGNQKLPFGRNIYDGDEQGVDFWYLLIEATDDDGIHVEISRPTEIDAVGHVRGWSDRLIIGRVDPGGDGSRRRKKAPVVPPAIDVPVRRKSA